MIDNICVQPGSNMNPIAIPIDSWYEAIDDGLFEIKQHFRVMIYDNIINDEDMYTMHKVLLLCELPFTIARQVTVPIPCEGYYCRGLVGLSLIVSPIWFVFYLWHGHETNLLGNSITRWMIFAVFELCVTIFALCIVRYAPRGGPNGNGEMSLLFATPIALYGFVIAATWIDTIADALVSLLNFIGILLRIPGPVIGLTILAWGNSMGDLSANMTMARKGLANMAMTACFAGPVFNILVGLGLGFSSLAAQTGNITTDVTLSPSVVTGFVFIAINGISLLTIGLGFGSGRIPKQIGYLSLVVYSIYLIVSISLQYSKSNDR
jgi:sodium/potassium/calcium exchanger 6